MLDANLERRRSLTPHLRFLGAVALTLALALSFFFLLMRPPADDLGLMALFLTFTALFSVLVGYGAYRLGWMHRAPRILWVLLSGYILAGALTFVNVWVTARLMFASQHDLLLATVLLLFAGGIATSVGYFLSAALTDRITALDRAARQINREHLDVRVPVTGNDEMANLARTFNQMVAELEAAAHRQQELEALRRNLIAWIGHDLRTPLASIRAMVEALADGVVEDPVTVDRYLHTIRREIHGLSLLIDDLFELAQLEAGGIQLDCSLNWLSDLISDTIESFSELAARQDVVLEGSVEPGMDPVLFDVRQVSRVLSNLVGNALRHTPARGRVEIRALAVDDAARVEITDTGEGIEAEDLPHIFEHFYRAEKSRSRATGGAGLGLAIAKGIIEAHGGEIGASSTPGRGTTLYFTIPHPTT
ncbi:MAG: HAMP domain-containing sensor histidine kinase [Anaerolineae bacterium]|jgi:signal transduction histidine kinase